MAYYRNAYRKVYVAPGHVKRSMYRGVYWDVTIGAWLAAIYINNKKHDLGYYTDETEAAKAYDEAARKLLGDRAFTNFGYLRLVKPS